MNAAKNMDSVFSDCTDSELEFDVMYDIEDNLIDTINGVNEAGDPLTGVDFPDLHQTDDDATVDDLRNYDGEGDDFGNKNAEGTKENEIIDTSVKGEENKGSDADDFIKDADKNYQKDCDKCPKVEPNSVTNTIEDVIESCSLIDSLFEADGEILSGADFEDHHQTDDDATVKDVKEYDGEGDDFGNKNAEGTNKEDQFKEEAAPNVEALEDEIANEKDAVDEAADVDSDVAKVDASDVDDEDDIIDAAIGMSNESDSSSTKYDYEPSDEDLIDMAMNS